jgi:hypothetical protein
LQKTAWEQLNRIPSTHYLEIKLLSAPAARINLSGQTRSIYLAAKVQEANEGVEKVRRLETQQDEFQAAALSKRHWIFRKNPETHTEREPNVSAIWIGSV